MWLRDPDLRHGIGKFALRSQGITGWISPEETVELARRSYAIDGDAVIVEIGSFLGRGAVALAGGRKLRGQGRVYCVDPFDASGEDYSRQIYAEIKDSNVTPLRQRFQQNMAWAGVEEWIDVFEGLSSTIVKTWDRPIDLLFLDADQSKDGAREIHDAWFPWLKVGGAIVVGNTADVAFPPGHDGSWRLAREVIVPPVYLEKERFCSLTFARKALGSA
jgi:predicted O-methyltransferase YrrM